MKKNGRIIRCIFLSILTILSISIVVFASVISLTFRPYDFELDITGVLSDYFMHTDLDRNITAYKTEHTMLYVQGECGFWVINLKEKQFKLLNTEIGSTNLNNVDSTIYYSIQSKRSKYKDRLVVLNCIEQLSERERKIYEELQAGKGEDVKVFAPKQNTRGGITDMLEQWGPYQQPLEYLLNL